MNDGASVLEELMDLTDTTKAALKEDSAELNFDPNSDTLSWTHKTSCIRLHIFSL